MPAFPVGRSDLKHEPRQSQAILSLLQTKIQLCWIASHVIGHPGNGYTDFLANYAAAESLNV